MSGGTRELLRCKLDLGEKKSSQSLFPQGTPHDLYPPSHTGPISRKILSLAKLHQVPHILD